MFEAELDVESFKRILSCLVLHDSGVFVADEQGIHFSETTSGSVAMTELHIASEYFDRYDCDSKVYFGLDISELQKIAKRLKKDEFLRLSLKTNENRFEILAKSDVERFFILPLLSEEEHQEHKSPKIPTLAHITMLPDVFKNAIIDADMVSDIVEFVADKDRLIIQASGVGNREIITRLDSINESIIKFDVAEPCRAFYPLSYLKDIIKVNAKDIVTLSFSTDMPLKLEYSLSDAAKVTYYIAPRRGM